MNESSYLGTFFFFRVQVASRHLHQIQNEFFANAIRLQKEETFATVWMDKKNKEIQVVVQGSNDIFLNEQEKSLIHCGKQ